MLSHHIVSGSWIADKNIVTMEGWKQVWW